MKRSLIRTSAMFLMTLWIQGVSAAESPIYFKGQLAEKLQDITLPTSEPGTRVLRANSSDVVFDESNGSWILFNALASSFFAKVSNMTKIPMAALLTHPDASSAEYFNGTIADGTGNPDAVKCTLRILKNPTAPEDWKNLTTYTCMILSQEALVAGPG